MIDDEGLRHALRRGAGHKARKARKLKRNEFPAIAQLMELHDGYWEIVRGCKRVVDAMMYAGKDVKPFLLREDDYRILTHGMARPDDWWRIVTEDDKVVQPEDPLMEVAAWDGAEPDTNCNCTIRFPVKWLYMSDKELNEMFRKGMDNEDN